LESGRREAFIGATTARTGQSPAMTSLEGVPLEAPLSKLKPSGKLATQAVFECFKSSHKPSPVLVNRIYSFSIKVQSVLADMVYVSFFYKERRKPHDDEIEFRKKATARRLVLPEL
jgi:hypothetical protein